MLTTHSFGEFKRTSNSIYVLGMGINQGRPVLMAVVDDLLICYEMYAKSNKQTEHLCICFRRLPHTVPLRSTPFTSSDGTRNEVCIERMNAS